MKGREMHTCQIMLVEADTPEDAFTIVAGKLNEGVPQWSDWHNADFSNVSALNFADRWTGEIFADRDEKGYWKDTDTNPNHLRYSDDPALAEQVITRFLDNRLQDIHEYQRKAIDLSTLKYDPYANELGGGLDLWATLSLARLLNNEWTNDTGIYDLHEWSATLRYFTTRVGLRPDKQFLIPVDFHF